MQMRDRDKDLATILSDLDISPTDFETARQRYMSVAEWLEDGTYESGNQTEIYLQGSFRLGTVIRPYRNSSDSDYDIDQVCEISGQRGTAQILKHDVGDRLKANSNYRRMLDDEGRRCWTLLYAADKKRPGFHLDVLPARLAEDIGTRIDITERHPQTYIWQSSNPKAYYRWFKAKNFLTPELVATQSESIFAANRDLYHSATDVPKQLLRTPLQRAIQLMKRHRDVYFDKRDYRPISIILTTLCAHKYDGQGIRETVLAFVEYVEERLAFVVKATPLPVDNVLDFDGVKWFIKNPSDANENFADKWEKTPELAESFFAWVYQLGRDIRSFDASGNAEDLNLVNAHGTKDGPTYGRILLESMKEGPIGSTQEFLDLIHQGIRGTVSWSSVRQVAVWNVDYDNGHGDGKDIAWVNYYQVLIHSGAGLQRKDREHIRSILAAHQDDPAFIFCCNVLLGSATATMMRECVRHRGADVLRWPITRLARGQFNGIGIMIVPELP